MNINFYNIW